MFALDESIFGTVDHFKHRARRGPLNPFFSVGSVRRLQPVIDERVEACLTRMRHLKEMGELMNVVVVTSNFSNGKFCRTIRGRNRVLLPNKSL